MDMVINKIIDELQEKAMPFENYVYEPKATHQIIRKHLTNFQKGSLKPGNSAKRK